MTDLFADDVALFDDVTAPLLSRKEGLSDYLNRVDDFRVLALDEFQALDTAGKVAYNNGRLTQLGRIQVPTPGVAHLLQEVRRTLLVNRSRPSGRDSVVLSGASALGKTTACLIAMQWVHRQYRKQFPGFEELGHIPIVYVEVPAQATAKTTMGRFAEFLGLPVKRSDTLEDRTRMVVHHLNQARTKLVVVDEVHNLDSANSGNRESMQVLKGLANDVPSTFVFSGVNIDTSGFLSGERGRQFAARSRKVLLTPYPYATAAQRDAWASVVATFEQKLMLLGQSPGDLIEQAAELHQRTQGKIGSLVKVLTTAATQLIWESRDPAEEQLTREIVGSIPRDIDTELTQ